MNTIIPFTHDVTHFHGQRIICIGRNYAEHAREMGHCPKREQPFWFFKPVTALSYDRPIVLPSWSSEIHHEIELVVGLTQTPKRHCEDSIFSAVGAFGLGIDLTARDKQSLAKQKGRPWCQAKGFDGAAPISHMVHGGLQTANRFGQLTLHKNGELAQHGNISDMIWSIPELLRYLDSFIALQVGDLLFTGTPSGVGEVNAGDEITGSLEGLDVELHCKFI